MAALIDAVVADFHDLDKDVVFEEVPRLTMRLRPSLMRRAVRNLIENASNIAGSAEVRLVSGEREVAIEVADRGPGIPEAQREKVFDALHPARGLAQPRDGGAGLGLALAKAIVRDAGGRIGLAAREGGGLVATITLPR
ncbi:MAG: ATP-binding protein [Sphingomonas sp.]